MAAEVMELSSALDDHEHEHEHEHAPPTDSSSNSASLSSTPLTSDSDSISLASDTHKPQIEKAIALLEAPEEPAIAFAVTNAAIGTPAAIVDGVANHHTDRDLVPHPDHPERPQHAEQPDHSEILEESLLAESKDTTPSRPRRSRSSAPIYNISKLLGTDIHGKRRSKGDIISARRMRSSGNASQLSLVEPLAAGSSAASLDAAAAETKPVVSAQPQDNIVVESPDKRSAIKEEAVEPRLLRHSRSVGDCPSTPNMGTRPSSLFKEATRPKSSPRATATATASKKAAPEPRRSTRSSAVGVESLAETLASMSKRDRNRFQQSHTHLSRELKRLADTKEFTKVEEQPVLETYWSNGKFVNPTVIAREAEEKKRATLKKQKEGSSSSSASPPESPARKKVKTESPAEPEAEKAKIEQPPAAAAAPPPPKQRRTKKWFEKGLYAGQTEPMHYHTGLSVPERKLLSQLPELRSPPQPNGALPFPIYNGLRMLLEGRDFKLPYDICHPVLDQPKPKQWKKITKSRFVGDSLSLWKKNSYYDNRSMCVCTKEDGCGEGCLNRSVLYECNEHNCSIGREHCRNRAFQDLQERTKKGGRYRIGVEVCQTNGRGFGVRSNRCFEPGEIIMEYAGEIITEEECDRRMNEVYKDNECYYLMSFDQGMILDATTGSIARFVNHSCSPNCRMIKWIVSGTPRMALFAGDRPIMTGDELTYDYNFDPFSAKNVQKCLCGSDNCRGVLGPKTRNDNLTKAAAAAGAANGGGAAGGGSGGSGAHSGNGKKGSSSSSASHKNKAGGSGSGSSPNVKKIKKEVEEKITTTKAAKRKLEALMNSTLLAGDDSEDGNGAGSGGPAKKKRRIISATASAMVKKAVKGTAKTAATITRELKATITVNGAKSKAGKGGIATASSAKGKGAATKMTKTTTTTKTTTVKKTMVSSSPTKGVSKAGVSKPVSKRRSMASITAIVAAAEGYASGKIAPVRANFNGAKPSKSNDTLPTPTPPLSRSTPMRSRRPSAKAREAAEDDLSSPSAASPAKSASSSPNAKKQQKQGATTTKKTLSRTITKTISKGGSKKGHGQGKGRVAVVAGGGARKAFTTASFKPWGLKKGAGGQMRFAAATPQKKKQVATTTTTSGAGTEEGYESDSSVLSSVGEWSDDDNMDLDMDLDVPPMDVDTEGEEKEEKEEKKNHEPSPYSVPNSPEPEPEVEQQEEQEEEVEGQDPTTQLLRELNDRPLVDEKEGDVDVDVDMGGVDQEEKEKEKEENGSVSPIARRRRSGMELRREACLIRVVGEDE